MVTAMKVINLYIDKQGNSREGTDEEERILEYLESLRDVRIKITIEVSPAEATA